MLTCWTSTDDEGETSVSDITPKELHWQSAEKHLETVEREYNKLIGVAGVNVMPAILLTLHPIRARFNRGERSEILYVMIMELE